MTNSHNCPHPQPCIPNSQNSPPEYHVSYAAGGTSCRTTITGDTTAPQAGKRGQCSGTLTARAAARIRERVDEIDRTQLPKHGYFMTLTYPGEWSKTSSTWERNRRAFMKRLERQHPGFCSLSVLEYQDRGAPHYHFIIWTHEPIDRAWLGTAWYEIVGSGDVWHLARGTDLQPLRSFRGARSYCSKYVSKAVDQPNPIGIGRRNWHDHNLPRRIKTRTIDRHAYMRLRRLQRRFLESALGTKFRQVDGSGLKWDPSDTPGMRTSWSEKTAEAAIDWACDGVLYSQRAEGPPQHPDRARRPGIPRPHRGSNGDHPV